jgi:acetylornithine deacetylase/succinyl-diaminopimelate desuccinylase-like protein
VGTTGTTCIATMLKAGHAENALPQAATATVNCRIFPGEGVENTLATLKKVVGNPDIGWKPLADDYADSASSPLRADVMQAVENAVHASFPGLTVLPQMESGGTDGKYFRATGWPTYGIDGVYMKMSEMFAHGLNERVPVSTVPLALDHWHRILTELAGK